MSIIFLAFLNSAFAQDAYDAHGFRLAPSDGGWDDPLAVSKSETMEEGHFSSEVLLEYAYQPLTLHSSDGTDLPLVEDLSVLNFGFGYDFTKRVGLRASVPVVGYDDGFTAGLGDSRVSIPVLLYGIGHGLSISGTPYLDVTSPTPIEYLSDEKNNGGAIMSGTYLIDRVSVSANAGIDLDSQIDFYNLVEGPSVPAGLAVSYQFSPTLALRGETQYDLGFKKNLEPGKGTPGEATLSLRGQHQRLFWTVGAATGLNESASVATARGFLGAGFAWDKKKQEVQTQRMELTITLEYPEKPVCEDHYLTPVYFDFDQDTIRDQDMAYLEKTAEYLNTHPEITMLKISGGADNRGSLAYNQDLALRRVKAIGQYLTSHGVAADRLSYDSLGEEHPQHLICDDEGCHSTNRFVEFTIISVSME